jgi:hypothetical protein
MKTECWQMVGNIFSSCKGRLYDHLSTKSSNLISYCAVCSKKSTITEVATSVFILMVQRPFCQFCGRIGSTIHTLLSCLASWLTKVIRGDQCSNLRPTPNTLIMFFDSAPPSILETLMPPCNSSQLTRIACAVSIRPTLSCCQFLKGGQRFQISTTKYQRPLFQGSMIFVVICF